LLSLEFPNPEPDPNSDPEFQVNPDTVPDPDPGLLWPKIEKNTAEIFFFFF
jgi:hypothetical protein